MLKRKLGDKVSEYGVQHDRIRLIEDTTGAGKADKAEVWADGFHDIPDGIGAGLVQRRQVSRFAEEALREQRQPRRLPRTLTDEQVLALVEAATREDGGRADSLVFSFSHSSTSTGCSPGE